MTDGHPWTTHLRMLVQHARADPGTDGTRRTAFGPSRERPTPWPTGKPLRRRNRADLADGLLQRYPSYGFESHGPHVWGSWSSPLKGTGSGQPRKRRRRVQPAIPGSQPPCTDGQRPTHLEAGGVSPQGLELARQHSHGIRAVNIHVARGGGPTPKKAHELRQSPPGNHREYPEPGIPPSAARQRRSPP